VMGAGRVVAEGPPSEVLTAERVEQVWGVPVWRGENGATGAPVVLPVGRPLAPPAPRPGEGRDQVEP